MEEFSKDTEKTNCTEIHSTELETTTKNLVVTSEKSHIERTQETTEKIKTEENRNVADEASIENGDISVMGTNDEPLSQIARDDNAHLEDYPTEVDKNVVVNCHESTDEPSNISVVNAHCGSATLEQTNNITQSFVNNNEISAEKEESQKHMENLETNSRDSPKMTEAVNCDENSNVTEKYVDRDLSEITVERSSDKTPSANENIKDNKEGSYTAPKTEIVSAITPETQEEELAELVEEKAVIHEPINESRSAEWPPVVFPVQEEQNIKIEESSFQKELLNPIVEDSLPPANNFTTQTDEPFPEPQAPLEMPEDRQLPSAETFTVVETDPQIYHPVAMQQRQVASDEIKKPEPQVPIAMPEEDQVPAVEAPTVMETQPKMYSPVVEQQTQIGSAEIKEENLKNQLQEIIKEIDREVDKNEADEQEIGGTYHHTWKPKGKYDRKKVEIKHEEVIPIKIPDINITERKKQSAKPQTNLPKSKPTPPVPPPKPPQKPQENGEPITPIEIPEGLPLLAKIASKEESGEANREKIPLERLFTPATDAEDITTKKRKIFGSSSFYSPDHPTIEDQVELAHKISVSLIDEENKTSKGHSMYMKRKNKSSKWIHAADEEEGNSGDYVEAEDLLPPKESKTRPPLKLLMNPKGLHDYASIQQSYEENMSSSSNVTHNMNSFEGCREIISDMQSPTGKGAALFAKRKRRMDKFIVDENSVQKNNTMQDNSYLTQQQQEFNSIANSLSMLPHSIESSSAGSLILPDITKILTQPKPFDKKSIKARSGAKGKTGVKREYSWNISTSKKETTTPKKNINLNNATTASAFDPYIDLRPGTPPMFVISDRQGNLMDKSAHFNSTNDVQDQLNSGANAIYTAEVKVVQSPPIPATPILELPTPQMTHFDRLSSDSLEDKRKSFNLAAKGWGTYNDFYTPLHCGGAST